MKRFALLLFLAVSFFVQGQPNKKPVNIIFILSDDHRYDCMGFMGAVPGLQTLGMDKMAKEGMHCKNAFVSTALCSPSRASILTGQYAHTHTVVDNDAPMPTSLIFYPEYLQKKGYKTAFMGKWHMGNTGDQPQKGFDEWVSFNGQGKYYDNTLNVNGERIKMPADNYITDELTDRAIKWMDKEKNGPFCMYLSHKGVHSLFEPAKRHKGKYKNIKITSPASMFLTATAHSKNNSAMSPITSKVNYADIPNWVRNQRNSWHGVDYMYFNSISYEEFYRLYLETLMAIDESILSVLDWVEKNALKENTMIVYMGDNGFQFGEHGLIDKRTAYEASMRVPLLVWAPGMVKAGAVLEQMILNVDIAPTFLDIAGIPKPNQMQGQSAVKLIKGEKMPNWRNKIFYEYYWESSYPETPTTFSIRTDRYKYIAYHGIWDINEVFDLKNDPYEMNNLIRDTAYNKIGMQLRDELYAWLESTGGLQIPLKIQKGEKQNFLYKGTY